MAVVAVVRLASCTGAFELAMDVVSLDIAKASNRPTTVPYCMIVDTASNIAMAVALSSNKSNGKHCCIIVYRSSSIDYMFYV